MDIMVTESLKSLLINVKYGVCSSIGSRLEKSFTLDFKVHLIFNDYIFFSLISHRLIQSI